MLQHTTKALRRKSRPALRGYAPLIKVAYSPPKAHAARLRKQKQRRRENGLVITEIESPHDELIAALEHYCAGYVDCAGIPAVIDAVEAVRSNRPGWMNDSVVRGAILQHVAVAGWLMDWTPKK